MKTKDHARFYIVLVKAWVKKDHKFLLAQRGNKELHKAGSWSLPGGKVDQKDEPDVLRKSLKREVQEETGIKARLVARIPETETYVYQQNGVKIFKRVVYFLMEYVSGKTKNHSFETEEVAWLPYKEALEKLEFKGAKEVLKRAKKLLKESKEQPKLL